MPFHSDYKHLSIELSGNMLANYEDHSLIPHTHNIMHTHHHLEISMIKGGTGFYHVGDQTYDIKEGDIFLFNNIEPHGIETKGPKKLDNMVIHFEPRLIWSDPHDLFNSRYLSIFFDRPKNFSHRIGKEHPLGPQLIALMKDLELEFLEERPEYAHMIKVKILNILVLLIRHYYSKEAPTAHSYNAASYDLTSINKVIYHIHHHYMEPIKLENLANLIYMNPSYFSRFFKKYNGLSPMDYLARIRIQEAIHLLKNSSKSISEITYACGFNNATSFNKTFKKINGCSPSEYRKGLT